MTDREKAVVMAYTGVCMLKGDKLGVYYKYLEEIMGGPVTTLDIAILAEDIKHRAKPDFLRLCAEDGHAGWALNDDGLYIDGVKAVDMAAIAGLIDSQPTTDVAPKSAWISVDERLPEESACYLVNIINHSGINFVTLTHYTKDYGWGVSDVANWMPLPEPPITDKPTQE